ncbi:hypothetical protein Xsze_04375 [Xenorhabdus szentirmaii DSM 16338]|nr:hypothetical protein Xsze_04375 [Xenorhabdus szentirmaii DSM 16338]
MAPFGVLRKIHHSFRHVLTVELGFIKRHIGLQHAVGQHVIQPRIGPLNYHGRETGDGTGGPLNYITHQVLKPRRDAI